jgi:hypothetical protein
MKLLKLTSIFLLPSILLAAPNNPSNLHFTNIGVHSVTLNWEDNSDNETGFKIYRNDTLITTLPKNSTTFTDIGLNSSTKYRYTIKATDDLKYDDKIKEAIGLGEIGSIRSITYTPQKGGVLVSWSSQQGSELSLVSLSDPENPIFEYALEIDDMGHKSYDDIQMKGDGIVEYTTYSYEDQVYSRRVYDYFNKKLIKTYVLFKPKFDEFITYEDKIKQLIGLGEIGNIRSLTYTPQKGGVLVSWSSQQGSELSLIGLGNPENPVFEYAIEIDDMGHKSYDDIQMNGDGIVEYTTYSYEFNVRVRIVYDYFSKQRISRNVIGK